MCFMVYAFGIKIEMVFRYYLRSPRISEDPESNRVAESRLKAKKIHW